MLNSQNASEFPQNGNSEALSKIWRVNMDVVNINCYQDTDYKICEEFLKERLGVEASFNNVNMFKHKVEQFLNEISTESKIAQ